MLRINLQHPPNDSFGRVTDRSLLSVPHLPAGDQSIELELVTRTKGKDTHNQQIENHPQSPNISLSTIVRHLPDQLGAHVCRCPTEIGQRCAAIGTEPEIYQLDVSLIVDEDVIRFQITMTDALFMAVIYPLQNLLKIPSSARLRETPLLSQDTCKTLLSRIFHDQIQLPPLFDQIDQFDHSRTVQHPQVPYLPLDVCQPGPLQSLNLFVSLYGEGLFVLAEGEGDDREGTFTDVRHHLQVLQYILTRQILVEVTGLVPEVVARDWSTCRLSGHPYRGAGGRDTLGSF